MTTRLLTDRIAMWWTTLTVPAPAGVLDDAERDRAARFIRAADRLRFEAARAWLRTVLGSVLGSDPAELRFISGPHGKPYLAGEDLGFNLSHSGDHAVVAIADGEVGIDVEEVVPGAYERPAAAIVMSQAELRHIDTSADPDDAFVRVWTRKEAYGKALGGGLQESLRAVTLLAPHTRHDGVDVFDVSAGLPGLHVAVATTTGAEPGEVRRWPAGGGS